MGVFVKLEGSRCVDGTTGAEKRNVFWCCWMSSGFAYIKGEVRRDGEDAYEPVDHRFRAPSDNVSGAARLLIRGDGDALSRFPGLKGSVGGHLGEGTGERAVEDKVRELLGVYSEEGRDAGSAYLDKSVPSVAVLADVGNERDDPRWLSERLLKSIERRSESDCGWYFLELGIV
jgi:hypothetical protein